MRVCFSVNLDTQRRYDNSSSILTANSFGSGMNSRGALSVLMFTTPGFVTAVQSRCVTSDSSRLLSYTHLHTNIHTHTHVVLEKREEETFPASSVSMSNKQTIMSAISSRNFISDSNINRH